MKTNLLVLTPILAAMTLTSCAKNAQTSNPAKADSAQAQSQATASKTTSATDPAGTTVGNVTVVDAVACRSVEDRSPVGTAEMFTAEVGRVFLFTNVKLTNGTEGTIQHVWFFGGKEVAKVTLPVQGARWRTYSSKAIDPAAKGDWRVDITTDDNKLIKSIGFKVQ